MTDPELTAPTYFGKVRKWRFSDILLYEAELNGEEPPDIPENEDRWVSAKWVRDRFGVSNMWIWRRLHGKPSLETAPTPETVE